MIRRLEGWIEQDKKVGRTDRTGYEGWKDG